MRSAAVPSVRHLASFFLLATLVAFIGVFLGHDSVSAATFDPSGSVALANNDPNAISDIVSEFGIGLGPDGQPNTPDDVPDSNFGATINFLPPSWGLAKDADVTDGAWVGDLNSVARLGLLSNGCKDILQPEFRMLEATTNMSSTVTFLEQFEDADGDQVPNGAEKYPDFLTRTLVEGDPVAGGSPVLQPIARLYGQAVVSSVDVSLNFVIFDKTGITIQNEQLSPDLGYPSVTVLQNLGDPEIVAAPSAITDFCSPLLSTTTLFGTTKDNPDSPAAEAAKTYRTNPGAGTYNFVNFSASQRDADGDGMENGLDSCPFVDAPPDYDPRAVNPTSDLDLDGLPDNCDPTPDENTGGSNDHELDGYANRGDNCPVHYNGPGTDDNQKDTDRDGIGDACDGVTTAAWNPQGLGDKNVADGEPVRKCLVTPVDVGAGGTPTPASAADLMPCGTLLHPPGPAAGDSDGDGVADSEDDCASTPAGEDVDANGCSQSQLDDDADGVPNSIDRCANTPAGATVDAVGCTPEQAVLDDDNDGVKNIDDVCPGTASGASVDADGCSAAQLATDGGDGGPDGPGSVGVGSLAPAISSIPAWAAIASGLGGAGLLGSLTAFASRIFGIRLPFRRRDD